jgi:asparagine synthase (glutamine-hydrolysing)
MSGIFGYCGRPDQDAYAIAARMGAALRHLPHHRTREDRVADGAAIGVHGAGRIGPPAAPAQSADGSLRAWLAGDVYGRAALRRRFDAVASLAADASDAEVALATYQSAGIEGLSRLDGEFLVAVWDRTAGELVIVNDRFGLYPHYFCHTQGALVFSPELKALGEAPGFRARLDLVAVAEYTRFQHILGDRTWLDGVDLLPYASVLRYRPGDDALTLSRYWDWDRVPRLRITFDEAVERGAALMTRAVARRCGSGERIGVFLSGGLDGRLLVGSVPPAQKIDTLTFGDPGCRDVRYARQIADAAGTRHHLHPLLGGQWVLQHLPMHLALTEGLHSWVHMHGISMLGDARDRIDVNLTGWDGGTIVRGLVVAPGLDGPVRHFACEADLEARLFDASCRTLTWPGVTDAETEALTASTRPGLARLAADSFVGHVRRTAVFESDRRGDFFLAQHHLRRLTINMVVMTRAAIGVRCPFFDYDVVDLSYGLPSEIRASPDYFRALLARVAPRLAWIPYEADLRLPHANAAVRWAHALPNRLEGRLRRMGVAVRPDRPRLYADYENYLRGDLRVWAEGILFDRRTQDRGLFDQHAVRALWDRHLAGRELWTIGKIAPLIAIEQSCRYLVDGDPPEPAALGPAGPLH